MPALATFVLVTVAAYVGIEWIYGSGETSADFARNTTVELELGALAGIGVGLVFELVVGGALRAFGGRVMRGAPSLWALVFGGSDYVGGVRARLAEDLRSVELRLRRSDIAQALASQLPAGNP